MAELNGKYSNQELTTGIVSDTGVVRGQLTNEENTISGTVVAPTETLMGAVIAQEGSLSAKMNNKQNLPAASLTIKYGADGRPGEDGFSPTISVYEETENTYVLEITDINGSYLTPNLKGEGGGGGSAEDKVDEDLADYRQFDPVTLTMSQRESSYLYVRRDDKGENTKIDLASISLEVETNKKIRQKLQTVQERPTKDWKVGDYIFLETGESD